MSSINKKYLGYLSTHPLLTKSITAAVLASLNEVIASLIAKEFSISSFHVRVPTSNRKVLIEFLNPYNSKIPLLAVFAFLIQAPFSHYSYKLLNNIKYFHQKPLSLARKLAQIVLSLVTITPVVCVLNAGFLGLLNNPDLATSATEILNPDQLKLILSGLQGLANTRNTPPETIALKNKLLQKLKFILSIVKTSLDKNLLPFLKSSWVTSPLILFFAQNYLDPNSWVVFFNFAYFVLGTVQNSLLKLRLKELRQQDEENIKKEDQEKEK